MVPAQSNHVGALADCYLPTTTNVEHLWNERMLGNTETPHSIFFTLSHYNGQQDYQQAVATPSAPEATLLCPDRLERSH